MEAEACNLRTNRINQEQDEPRAQLLLYASDAAHAQSQRYEVARAYLAVILSGGSFVAAFAHSLGASMAIVGVVGAVVVYATSSLGQKHAGVATRIQEMFDTELFRLQAVPEFGPPPIHETVLRLASRFKGDTSKKLGWYALVDGLPQPYAVLVCQRENLSWDWKLRRRWATTLGVMASSWVAVGIAFALAFDWSTREVFLWWFAPSLPGLTYATDLVRGHLSTARDKQQFVLELDECLVTLPTVTECHPTLDRLNELMAACRTYQDRITRLRLATVRVPRWFYDRYRDEDEEVARRTAEDFRLRLLGGSTS